MRESCLGVKRIKIKVRGYAKGIFQIKTSWNGPILAQIPVNNTNVWEEYSSDIDIEDGIHSIYFTYVGGGKASLFSFTLEA